MAAPLTLLALLIELMVGYPDRLVQSIGHPVTWMGRLIAWLDRRLNREGADAETRRRAGAAALLVLFAVVGVVAFVVEQALLLLPFGLVLVAILASTLLAQRSLFDACRQRGRCAGGGRRRRWPHGGGADRRARYGRARRGRRGARGDRELGREFLGRRGGADDLHGHRGSSGCRTLQGDQYGRQHDRPSHRTPPGFRQDGGAARRFRQSSRLAALGAADRRRGRAEPKVLRPSAAWQATWRDGPKHVSPNAGYPEAAMAGALGLALGGPRVYRRRGGGRRLDGRWAARGRA